jgi:hypothetical protein
MPVNNPVSPLRVRVGPALLLGAALAVLALGCGGRRSVYPVTGQVLAGKDKKPAVGAMVVFHPVESDGGPMYKPNGYVDEQGRYSLTTYDTGDGAPAGEYIVTVEWAPARKSAFEEDKADYLKGAYSDPKKSKLPNFTVQSGAKNEVPVILLP